MVICRSSLAEGCDLPVIMELKLVLLKGEACSLTVGVFLLTVELLCLQSFQVLIRGIFHCKLQKKLQLQIKANIVNKKLQLQVEKLPDTTASKKP